MTHLKKRGNVQTQHLQEKDDLLIRRIVDYIERKNPQEFNLEKWYHELLDKRNRDEMEGIVFQMMDQMRNSIKEREELLSFSFQESINKNVQRYKKEYIRFLDWQTRPIHQWEYEFMLSYTNRHVALEIIESYEISTVWLGLNHAFFAHNPPLIFETMIFNVDESKPYDEDICNYQKRYTYKNEAIAGHKKALRYVRAKLKEK